MQASIIVQSPRDPGNVRYRCRELADKLVEQFPELRRAAGYYTPLGETAPVAHWWCVAPDGSIVDPSAHQFLCMGEGEYAEVKEENLPLQPCMGCGGDVFRMNGGTKNEFAPEFCSRPCHDLTMATLTRHG